MKTDRFSDAIRRKLESIRPEFTEKDWTRMQASLQTGVPQPAPTPTSNPFSGGVWSNNPWFLAAVSISTVALIAVGIWQRSEINSLRQTVSQLQQKPVPTQVAPAPPTSENPTLTRTSDSSAASETPKSSSTRSEPGASARQRDTVYIDRYVTAPAPSRSERKTNSISNSQNDTYDVSSTPVSPNKNKLTKPTQSVAATQPASQPVEPTRSGEKVRNKLGRNDSYTDTYSPTTPKLNKVVTDQTVQTTPQRESVVETTSGASASYESIASRPLSTKSINWSALLARQAQRMRSTQPTAPTPVTEKAPTVEPESRVERVAIGVRVGVGAEIASQLWGNGVFSEVLLSQNFLLGVGLNQTAYKTTFIDDYAFFERTRRNFRGEFAPNMDQKRDILSINTRTTRLQIPLYLGYRVPITQSIAFLPTVGTYLNLNSTENATFYSPKYVPKREYEEYTISKSRSIDLINSLAFGAGVEWHSKHWVAQASPVLTIPFQSTDKPPHLQPDWQQNTTVGLRARVLYQF